MASRILSRGCVLVAAFTGSIACSGNHSGTGEPSPSATTTPDAAVPFQPNTPATYVAKVKNLLVGLPPTDDEVKSVEADPTQLSSLIDAWMKLPEYSEKMKTFFELAFQQTQISVTDLADQAYPRQIDVNASTRNLLTENVKESFARTVLELVAEGRPFTETMTTRRFMLTPALMELYAFLDVWQVDDAGKVTDRFHDANPNLTITVEASGGPVPIAQTVDPSSPNYLHFYDPDVGNAKLGAGCMEDPITYAARADALHYLLEGALIGRKSISGTTTCQPFSGTAAAPQLTATDYTTWKMVTVRPPAAGEPRTAFYDLPTLRTATDLVITTPRVGFFSTPAFFANWQTNTSNQMRVTINQTLIVATGASVDGTDPTIPATTPGLDPNHASGGACLSCHQTLDPTRSIFASTYSWNYHDQTDPAFAGQKGLFAFQGVQKQLASVDDLGATLAAHPLFAAAWPQKLCYYANSAACSTTDPEFLRITTAFASAGYSWNALVRDFFASPLTTNASATETTRKTGQIVAVSRRDHICAALNERLGFTDVCGLSVFTAPAPKSVIPEIVAGLPSDGYGRGAVAPVLPNQPTLFYRAGMENICEATAALVIDTPAASQRPGAKQWSGASPDTAIADFVGIVMGLPPSDPRAAPATTLLRSHFDAAVKTGAKNTDALRSTFVAACLAPSAVSIGM